MATAVTDPILFYICSSAFVKATFTQATFIPVLELFGRKIFLDQKHFWKKNLPKEFLEQHFFDIWSQKVFYIRLFLDQKEFSGQNTFII